MTITEFNKDMAAVAFAEAGEHETAKKMASNSSPAHNKGTAPHKRKPYLPATVFGAISLSAYFLLFQNESLVTETFTKGGIYTLFPVGAAFLFSFVHGAFASNLLTVLGLEAKK